MLGSFFYHDPSDSSICPECVCTLHFHSIQLAFIITPALDANLKEEINKKTKELFKAAGGDEENMQGLVTHDKVGSLALFCSWL